MHPLDALRNLPQPSGMYYRWLLERVLEDCYTTAWCASQIGADPKIVERDLVKAILWCNEGFL